PMSVSLRPSGSVICPLALHFVSVEIPRQISLRRVGFSIELSDPDAMRRFSILVHAIHSHLDFVPLLGVSDRRVLAHARREFRLRLIEFPCADVRVSRKTTRCRGE